MTVNAPKTPGMTMRRTKRKKEEKRIEIDVDSPNTSIVSFADEVQGNKENIQYCCTNSELLISRSLKHLYLTHTLIYVQCAIQLHSEMTVTKCL